MKSKVYAYIYVNEDAEFELLRIEDGTHVYTKMRSTSGSVKYINSSIPSWSENFHIVSTSLRPLLKLEVGWRTRIEYRVNQALEIVLNDGRSRYFRVVPKTLGFVPLPDDESYKGIFLSVELQGRL
jgi:hypothetical protein